MRARIEYYIILTIDIPKGSYMTIKRAKPLLIRYPTFRVTEDEVEDTSWSKAHRQYVGVLSPDKTEILLQENFSQTCKTMGILELSRLRPAIAFDSEDDSCYMNAYVSPIINPEDEKEIITALEKHPDAKKIKSRVGGKLTQCLDLLENFYEKEKLGESFFVDLNQLCLNFGEEANG